MGMITIMSCARIFWLKHGKARELVGWPEDRGRLMGHDEPAVIVFLEHIGHEGIEAHGFASLS